MKAQIHGPYEVMDFVVELDDGQGKKLGLWLPESELVDLTEEELALVLQYRELSVKYYNLCEAKKAEQDAKAQ